MRGFLVVNPKATTTSARTRDVLAGALRSEMKLTVGYTRGRGHGYDLACTAAKSGADVVIALGGDGTVNEVINGLMSVAGKHRPALAVVPGGSTNVFVRALGLPRHPVEATGLILSALRAKRTREIGLGLAGDRYFTFCAGMGIDAAVVRRVERARRRGRRSTPALFLRSALGEYFLDAMRHAPALTLSLPDEELTEPVHSVIVQNTAPWTYLGERPVHASPEASFDTGLDVLALKLLRPPSTLQAVSLMLSLRDGEYGKRVLLRHDVTEFTVTAAGKDHTEPLQLDGDYLGEREEMKFRSVPKAIRVVC